MKRAVWLFLLAASAADPTWAQSDSWLFDKHTQQRHSRVPSVWDAAISFFARTQRHAEKRPGSQREIASAARPASQ